MATRVNALQYFEFHSLSDVTEWRQSIPLLRAKDPVAEARRQRADRIARAYAARQSVLVGRLGRP